MNHPLPRALTLLVSATLLLGGTVLPAQAATLRARVSFAGKPPRLGALKRTDLACRGSPFATEETVLVNPASYGLKNVIVYISRGLAAPPAPRDAELSTISCMFRPRVAAVTPGGSVRITNGDNLSHLWHGFLGVQSVLLQKQEPGASPAVQVMTQQPGQFVRLRDDLRPWMEAFVMVVPSAAYGVTGDNGDVALADVPPGTYTLTAWHERYGSKSQDVVVTQDANPPEAKFTFDGSEARP